MHIAAIMPIYLLDIRTCRVCGSGYAARYEHVMAARLDNPGQLPVEIEQIDIHRGLVRDDAVEPVVRKTRPQHILKVEFHLVGTAALMRKPLRELNLVGGEDRKSVVEGKRGELRGRP